jgi:hypothetical protein
MWDAGSAILIYSNFYESEVVDDVHRHFHKRSCLSALRFLASLTNFRLLHRF